MKIAILGTGGVGEDVRFIARGAHLEAIRTGGLRIESANGNVHVQPVDATDRPADIGPVDLAKIRFGERDATRSARVEALLRAAMDEAVAVTHAKGIRLPDDLAERHMAMVDGLPATMGSSMLHDFTHEKRLELPWLSGTVVRMGREAGVFTPTHDTIAAALKLHADGH